METIEVLNCYTPGRSRTIRRMTLLKRNGEVWARFDYKWFKVYRKSNQIFIDYQKPITGY
jgi:hypothetical protein